MSRPRSPGRTTASADRRSGCPIACALDVLGDRWTLLVVRDLFRGMSRYGEFAAGPEGIPTNLLADRLKKLEAAGLIASEPYQQNPTRYAYRLTPRGCDLKPVLAALGHWSMRHVPHVKADSALYAALRA